MAIVKPMHAEAFEAWANSRPQNVAEAVRAKPPDRLYLMDSGHRCTIHSYGETDDGRVLVSVDVTGQYNRVAFARRVFGIDPESLTECELPGPDEDVGDTSKDAGMTSDDVANILFPAIKLRMAGNK